MKGNIRVRKLGHRASVSQKAFSERFGGVFALLIEPFYGDENERFYYARNCPDGCIELEGEGYIISGKNMDSKRRRQQRNARRKLGNNPVWYYWLNIDNRIINKVPVYPPEEGDN